MKIIFLINSPFPYYAGGIETWLYNVSKRLCNEHEITIIARSYRPYPFLFNDIPDRIRIVNFKTMSDYGLLRPFLRSYMNVVNLFVGSLSMAHTLREILKDGAKYYVVALDTMFNVSAANRARKNNNNVVLIASSRGPHATGIFPAAKETQGIIDLEIIGHPQALPDVPKSVNHGLTGFG